MGMGGDIAAEAARQGCAVIGVIVLAVCLIGFFLGRVL
jgi:hypothetical protein